MAKTEDTQEWKDYRAATAAMDRRVEAACKAAGHTEVHVDYSAYETDSREIPLDNLDQVALTGKVVMVGFADDFFGGSESRDFQSPVLENPTWLEACVQANKMILTTLDEHHVFLEGFTRMHAMDKSVSEAVGEPVEVYEFSMGS